MFAKFIMDIHLKTRKISNDRHPRSWLSLGYLREDMSNEWLPFNKYIKTVLKLLSLQRRKVKFTPNSTTFYKFIQLYPGNFDYKIGFFKLKGQIIEKDDR